MALSARMRDRVREVARGLLEELKASEGRRPLREQTFAEIEDEAVEISDQLSREMMNLSLGEQSQEATTESATCPSCGRPVWREAADPIEPRLLDTRRGEASWCEPKYYCSKCRKAFFPSVEDVGD